MFSEGIAPFLLEGLALIDKEPPVKLRAIGHPRLGGDTVSQGPVPGVKFIDDPPGVAPRVRRIVPGAVVHDAPSHKLRSRIVRIGVVVEVIAERKSSARNRKAGHGTIAR